MNILKKFSGVFTDACVNFISLLLIETFSDHKKQRQYKDFDY